MIEPRELKNRLATILKLCAAVNTTRHNTPERKAADKAFWDAVFTLDSDAGDGCQIGRLLKFGVLDGYARYIITRVNKKSVKVVHLPYLDAYKSNSVNADDEVWRDEAEDNLAWYDTINRMRRVAISAAINQRIVNEVAEEIGQNIDAPAEAVAL